MQLPEICIRRPVFTIVLSLIILSLGSIFFYQTTSGTPNINPPIITVNSEHQITKRIEKALRTIENLESMSSFSSVGASSIMLEFNLDADIEIALNDVLSMILEVIQFLQMTRSHQLLQKWTKMHGLAFGLL